MFHHIAMFRFKDGVSDATVAEVRRDLLALPAQVAPIKEYKVGRDAGLSDGTWDFVVVAGFDHAAGYKEYATNPDHLAVVKRILTLVSDRAAVQSGELG
ncbi:MAG: Dabb family protein [Acidimicrobiia bacterium]|nr:Dabb family protein [Acidimicrobiia bacterium]MDX2465840.1 Dabb family protein [Acidimicrobiia bacterium]